MKVLSDQSIDGKTIFINQDNKIEARQVPIVYNVTVKDGQASCPTGSTQAVLFLNSAGPEKLETLHGGVQGQIVHTRMTNQLTLVIGGTNSLRDNSPMRNHTAQLDSNVILTWMCLAPGIWAKIGDSRT